LTNIVTNGVQAMQDQETGNLSIKATRWRDTTTIIVQDTGVGIPEEVREKLFTPLFTTKSKGQGLGLAVVKRLVEGLGGTIEFDSEPNKGTKFTIDLPDHKHSDGQKASS
jgi:signal transduction histidine kinase